MTLARPSGPTWEDAERVWLHLEDELPRIGSGWRLVWVRIPKNKKFAYIAGWWDARGRLTYAHYNELFATSITKEETSDD